MAGRLTEIIRPIGLKFEEPVQSSMAINHSTDHVGQDFHHLAYELGVGIYREMQARGGAEAPLVHWCRWRQKNSITTLVRRRMPRGPRVGALSPLRRDFRNPHLGG